MPLSPTYSVILPVCNEQENLPALLSEIRQALDPLGHGWEVLAVDDGSRDDSVGVLTKLQDELPQLRVLRHRRNFGQSAAFATGLREARGSIIITLDADGQNDPADLPKLIAALQPGLAAALGQRARREDNRVRKLSSRIANWYRNRLTGVAVNDAGCFMRVMRAEALRELPVFNGLHRFVPTLLHYQGHRFVEVPVNHRPRRAGVSKYGIGNRLWRGIRDCFAMRWYRARALPTQRLAGPRGSDPGDPPPEDPGPAGTGSIGTRLLLAKALVLGALAIGGALIARIPGVREWMAPAGALTEQLQTWGAWSYPLFIGVAALLIGVGVPRLLFCPLAGAAFGFWGGLGASTAATMAAYFISFLFIRGRLADRDQPFELPRQLAFLRHDPGLGGVIIARLLPVPGLIGTAALSLSPVRKRDFFLGSLIGLIPEAVPLILLGAGLFEGNPKQLAWMAAGALVLVLGSLAWIRRLLHRERQRTNAGARA